MKKECVAMLLAGGQGSRLYVLTGDMAKPAVPFGGKFRIIDFPLSNCTNSGIDTVGVLTQYRPLELNSYIGSGSAWDLDGGDGGAPDSGQPYINFTESDQFGKKIVPGDNIAEKKYNFRYEDSQQVLFDINFKIRKGEMLAIVGRNGAGKSTLCKVICGFEKAESGSILLNGEDITNTSIRRRAKQIGYVMQNPNQMISQALIFDEVAMGIRNTGLSEEEIMTKVYDTLKICGLYEFRNWPISALSFGQKKRVTIASILVMGPDVIMLDEPTAGQDLAHYTEIMEFLKTLNRQGITIILITHDMHLMLEYTDRSLVFAHGRLIADQSGSSVLCDAELIAKASLKETSLFKIAVDTGIEDPVEFVDCFISYEVKECNNGK